MEEITNKSHRDYVDIIGETALTAKNYRERRWNQYYFSTNQKVVEKLLGTETKDVVLDVGCSHGSWFKTWKNLGFNEIHGVEISSERAEQARITGFNHVYNCEANSIPVEDDSYDIVCSSGTFIHILQLQDKLDVFLEIYRILKPGGVFIFNFTPPNSWGFEKDTINRHCSFYTLNTMIRDIITKSGFIIEDIKPTYYPDYSMFRKLIGYAIILPFTITLLKFHDFMFSRNIPIQKSSTIYLKLRK